MRQIFIAGRLPLVGHLHVIVRLGGRRIALLWHAAGIGMRLHVDYRSRLHTVDVLGPFAFAVAEHGDTNNNDQAQKADANSKYD